MLHFVTPDSHVQLATHFSELYCRLCDWHDPVAYTQLIRKRKLFDISPNLLVRIRERTLTTRRRKIFSHTRLPFDVVDVSISSCENRVLLLRPNGEVSVYILDKRRFDRVSTEEPLISIHHECGVPKSGRVYHYIADYMKYYPSSSYILPDMKNEQAELPLQKGVIRVLMGGSRSVILEDDGWLYFTPRTESPLSLIVRCGSEHRTQLMEELLPALGVLPTPDLQEIIESSRNIPQLKEDLLDLYWLVDSSKIDSVLAGYSAEYY